MPMSLEYKDLLKEIFAEMDLLRVEDLKALGEFVVSKGIESSGTRRPMTEDIYAKYGLKKASLGAELGVQDIGFREGKRQFDVGAEFEKSEAAERTRQFGIEEGRKERKIVEEQRRFDDAQKMWQETLDQQKEDSRQAAKDWWKPFAGQIASSVASKYLPLGLGALAKYLFKSKKP